MLLIGMNRSPFTRRVAITLHAYGVPYEQQVLTAFDNRDAVRALNPLGRIPALVLDSGEVLIDSGAILDHLDETYGGAAPLAPRAGADRRAVLRTVALAMGACDKLLHAAYERNHHPPEKMHQPWRDDCVAQVRHAFAALDAMAEGPHLLLGRLTHADIAAFVAERLARVGKFVDTEREHPRLRAFTRALADLPPFRLTEP